MFLKEFMSIGLDYTEMVFEKLLEDFITAVLTLEVQ